MNTQIIGSAQIWNNRIRIFIHRWAERNIINQRIVILNTTPMFLLVRHHTRVRSQQGPWWGVVVITTKWSGTMLLVVPKFDMVVIFSSSGLQLYRYIKWRTRHMRLKLPHRHKMNVIYIFDMCCLKRIKKKLKHTRRTSDIYPYNILIKPFENLHILSIETSYDDLVMGKIL